MKQFKNFLARVSELISNHASTKVLRKGFIKSMRKPLMRSPIMLGLCVFRKAEINHLLVPEFLLMKKNDLNIWDFKSSFQSSSRPRSSSLFGNKRNYKSSFVFLFLGSFVLRWCI